MKGSSQYLGLGQGGAGEALPESYKMTTSEPLVHFSDKTVMNGPRKH